MTEEKLSRCMQTTRERRRTFSFKYYRIIRESKRTHGAKHHFTLPNIDLFIDVSSIALPRFPFPDPQTARLDPLSGSDPNRGRPRIAALKSPSGIKRKSEECRPLGYHVGFIKIPSIRF